jgi:hypothetical protein
LSLADGGFGLLPPGPYLKINLCCHMKGLSASRVCPNVPAA